MSYLVKSLSTYRQLPTEQLLKSKSRNDEYFVKACNDAGIQPTGRQYSKWTRGRGLAAMRSKNGTPIDNMGTEIK